jgi:isopenicillin N synthase-like dioxygenase
VSRPNAHTAFREVPEVDVAGLYARELSERECAARELGRACRETGFCYVHGHRVPEQLISGLLQAARRFFALPEAAKLEHYIGKSQNHRGYVPSGEEVFYGGAKDQKEAFDLCFELPDGTRDVGDNPFAGPNVWPALPEFHLISTVISTSSHSYCNVINRIKIQLPIILLLRFRRTIAVIFGSVHLVAAEIL